MPGWQTIIASTGCGESLLRYAQSGSTPCPGGPHRIASFTLTASVADEIYGGVPDNGIGWVDDFGMAPPVQFGAEWIMDSGPGMWCDAPSIIVLPEPATLALLGFGLAGLLRRR